MILVSEYELVTQVHLQYIQNQRQMILNYFPKEFPYVESSWHQTLALLVMAPFAILVNEETVLY